MKKMNTLLPKRLSRLPTSSPRAEVAKLLVHTEYRRRGVATALMAALEQEARAAGRTLLVLDTQSGEPAEMLYFALGYVLTGSVPGYARNPDGRLAPTSFMYKVLE